MRIIKPKKLRGRPALAIRLGIAPTSEQTAEYLVALKAAKAKLARAKGAKPAAKTKIVRFPTAVAKAKKTTRVAGKKKMAA